MLFSRQKMGVFREIHWGQVIVAGASFSLAALFYLMIPKVPSRRVGNPYAPPPISIEPDERERRGVEGMKMIVAMLSISGVAMLFVAHERVLRVLFACQLLLLLTIFVRLARGLVEGSLPARGGSIERRQSPIMFWIVGLGMLCSLGLFLIRGFVDLFR